MPEEQTPVEESETEPPADTTPDTGDEVAKWKALARKNEAQAKANADAARRLAELEEKDKSELQKAADKATAAEQRAAEAEQRAFRLEVAAEKGLTPAQAARLNGATKEELLADADDLVGLFPADKGDAQNLSGKPVQKLRPGGASGSEEDVDPSVDEIVAQIRR